jgi:signal transduction histidine kinase/predicted RNA-binding protein with RPS1 domain/ActR/RegA family two-component response regulator
VIMSSSLLSRFPRYSIVAGQVVRVTGSKAIIALGEGVFGHIPARELAWINVDHPRRFVREGQQIETMVMGEDDVLGVLLLSRRLVLRNPWPTIIETYPIGTTHAGRISQIKSYGAFVELEPGVVGLAHTREIPQREDSDQPIELWPNDRVLVQVLAADPARHRLTLSIRAASDLRDQQIAQRRASASQSGTTIGEALGLRHDPLANIDLPWYDPDGPIQSILMVDDDQEFIKHTAEWLGMLGYHTLYALTARAGRELIARERPSLLLLDYELDEGTGLDLAEIASQQLPDTRIVLLSAQADQQICRQRNGALRLMCWNKPFFLRDFAELLRALDTEVCSICRRIPAQASISVDLMQRRASDRPTLAPLDTICDTELARLMAATGAQAGLICAVEPGNQQVQVIVHQGAELNISALEQADLIYTPINNICLRGETMRVADMVAQPAAFRYLLPLGHFRSLLGLPVRQSDASARLGILLFHQAADYFSEPHLDDARISAGFLGIQIERQQLLRMSLSAQQTILAGRLSLVMAHEVQKQLGTIGAHVETLNVRLHKLRRQNETFSYQDLLERGLPDNGARLQKSIQNVAGVLRRQLDFARAYTIQTFDLNTLVERTLHLLRPVASQSRVYLVHQLTPGLPPIVSAELLLQQIFLNLGFNAIEQMAAAGMVQGELRVSTAYVSQSPQPFRVKFSDCGPGIHAAHYEQIFELGFTTRTGGTGQGLYISRNAAEALGGELQLIESFMGFGSAFELALPVRAEEPTHDRDG